MFTKDYEAQVFRDGIAKSTDKLPCECYYCGRVFLKEKAYIKGIKENRRKKKTKSTAKYCNRVCALKGRTKIQKVNCSHCGKTCLKRQGEVKKSKTGNVFCSISCGTTYNNLHKTHGTTRSKIEMYTEEQLKIKYPNLIILFNQKSAINSELDVFIPDFKLAFELNGIFHYEPIHGGEKLQKIKNNDENKFQKCQSAGISLCVIDTSGLKRFSPPGALRYLNVIYNIMDSVIPAGWTRTNIFNTSYPMYTL